MNAPNRTDARAKLRSDKTSSPESEPFALSRLPSYADIVANRQAERTLWSQIEAQHPFFAECRTKARKCIFSEVIAKQSYDKLLAEGLGSVEMLELLVGLAALPAPKRKWDIWQDSGKAKKSLAYFPTRLRGVADEIERLNVHPLVRPKSLVHAYAIPEPRRKQIAASFVLLPGRLRHYAGFLEAQQKLVKKLLKHVATGKSGNRRALLRLVKSQTGKDHYEDVVNLLHAAGETVSTEALKMLTYRARKPRHSS
jgi:hypothetical protein